MNFRFGYSLKTLLFVTALVAVLITCFRQGEHRGRVAILNQLNQIDVDLNVDFYSPDADKEISFFRQLRLQDGKTMRLSAPELENLFIEITPSLIERTTDQLSIYRQKSPDGEIRSNIQLQNVPCMDVEQSLNDIASTLGSNSRFASDVVNNSIVVQSKSSKDVSKIEAILKRLDQPRKMYRVKLKLGQINLDGSETIVAKPHLLTIQELPAKFTMGSGNDFVSVEAVMSPVQADKNGVVR